MTGKAAFSTSLHRLVDFFFDQAFRVFDTAPAGIILATDLSCTQVLHNRRAAEFLRVQPAGSLPQPALPGRLVKLFSSGKELALAEMPLQRAAWRGEEVRDQEIEFRWEDGVVKCALFSASPFYGSSGESMGAIASFADITALKRAERESRLMEEALRKSEERCVHLEGELRRAESRQDEYLGILSHEIRNPLASIMMSISLLDRAAPGSEQAGRAREIMTRQAAHLTRLVDDLLDVTRISGNRIVLQNTAFELNEFVLRAVEDHQDLFRGKGIALAAGPASDALYVEADPARLTQVLGNLLQNAAKFTPSGGYTRVIVSGDESTQSAVIRVEDSGIGMDPDMLKNVFLPFKQADRSLDRKRGGLGLGLALVKGLVELHGGSVSVHSCGQGKGSVFIVRLPLAPEQFPAAPGEPETAGPVPRRRVLVIEDIQDVAESLKSLLEDEGHQVAVACDGYEGLVKAKNFQPDVLLCDIGLPGMDGYQVARAFCADEQLQDVFRVCLTGYARPEDFKRGQAAGFHTQLAKPVDVDTLRQILALV